MTGHGYDRATVDEQLIPAPAELDRLPVDEVARHIAISREVVEHNRGDLVAELESQRLTPSREARRAKSSFVVVTPAVRGKTTGLIGGPELLHRPQSAPNDMRPVEVDRKKIKARRKAAAANRRKRK